MTEQENRNIFPRWTNSLPLYVALGAVLLICFLVFVFWYWFSPKNLDVGYAPKQPIPFSHQLHAGEMGIDCRYCHINVERSPASTVPAAEICMNCHSVVKTDSPAIIKLKEYYTSNQPIPWVKVHALPDYVYFDHSRHVNSGVSCVSCHGRVDQMKVIHQVKPLSMSWCLDCHRAPDKNLRPHAFITQLDWQADDAEKMGKMLREIHHINPRQDCSTCHR